MPDPEKYRPKFNYSGWEAAGSKRPKPGASLDTDFANIARSIDETIDALKDLRRSDGKLQNGIVDKDALDESARELWESADIAAENAKGSAQSAAGSAASAGKSAEAARDYASDAVSQGNVPIYASVETVEGLNINPNITALRTNGYYTPGDGGGSLYKRVTSEPSHNSKVQSADGSWWEPVVPFGYAFDSVSDMQASRLVTPGARVRTLGYYTPGDGGGNDYEIVAAGTGTDDGGSFIDLSGSGLQAKSLHSSEIGIRQFGAVGDGVTEDTYAYNKALRYCSKNGITFRIDKGVFLVTSGGNYTIEPGCLHMRGYGEASTILRKEEKDVAIGSIITNDPKATGSQDYIRLENVTFSGMYDVTNWEGITTYIQGAWKKVSVSGCIFKNIFSLVTAFQGEDISFHGNRFENCARDGARAIASKRVRITNNYFYRLYDDAIAIHTRKDQGLVDPSVVISGNTLVECQGIAVLGAQNVVVTGNTLKRCHLRLIYLETAAGVEGSNTVDSISVTNNIIIDPLPRVWSVDGWVTLDWETNLTNAYTRCINITGPARQTGQVFSGEVSSGVITQPYGLYTDSDYTLASEVAKTGRVLVSGNVISRQHKYGITYSEAGFGALTVRNGTPPDLTLTSEEVMSVGVYLSGIIRNIDIKGNVFSGIYQGVGVKGSETNIKTLNIESNSYYDIHTAAISLYDEYSEGQASIEDVVIKSNSFDLDPYYLGLSGHDADFAASRRRQDGSYNLSDFRNFDSHRRSVFIASDVFLGMLSMYSNTFRNCYALALDQVKATNGSEVSNKTIGYNTFYIGIGSSDSDLGDNNRGIGQMSFAKQLQYHKYYDSDVTSETFGEFQVSPNARSTVPSEGFYLKGFLIKTANPSVNGFQWIIRTTTGTSHSMGTDWASVVSKQAV